MQHNTLLLNCALEILLLTNLLLFRASEAVKQMELSRNHEAEETAALEKMMQKVEVNLEATTVALFYVL